MDKDDYHCFRVSKLMEILLIEYSLSDKSDSDTLDIRLISKAAYFYDIGLMGVPSELIDLLAKCRSEILSYYKLLQSNNLITV